MNNVQRCFGSIEPRNYSKTLMLNASVNPRPSSQFKLQDGHKFPDPRSCAQADYLALLDV